MKLTCLSEGGGAGGGGTYYYPPCHMLQICGLRILLDCPLDLSALAAFSPVPAVTSSASASASASSSADLIEDRPWYKIITSLHLWDLSLIDAVLVSSPAGMLGLPFLTRIPNFKAKIYATEVMARIGKMWMKDLVSMDKEFEQFYGPHEVPGLPYWMRWKELEKLSQNLKQIVMGEDGEELGSWMPLYSAADVNECIQKVHPLKYGEETCFNGAIVFKAYSSGSEIGSCNWKINDPKRSVTYLSNSIFESASAMGFDYQSLQGNDVILFSDLSPVSCKSSEVDAGKGCSISDETNDSSYNTRTGNEAVVEKILGSDDSSEELDKINFICSCIIDTVQEGGSILIPTGRLGTLLFLIERISQSLDSSGLRVPIFVISDMAEEILSFTNAVPEWLSKQRQDKLFSGEALFGHSELMKANKLFAFRTICSSDLIKTWEEPCIVLSPHWSLRLGPVVHLLRRWHANPNCLLILEEEVDAEAALFPFRPVKLKVLQCSFLSGLKPKYLHPLLELLQPKIILFPECARSQCPIKESDSRTLIFYSKNIKLKVPCLTEFEAILARDLAVQLHPKRLNENMAIAKLKAKVILNSGKYFLDGLRNPADTPDRHLSYWGSPQPARLLKALQEKELVGSLRTDEVPTDGVHSIEVTKPWEALIETSAKQTTICCGDEETAARIYEALSSVLDGI